ncbi:MAG: hypothetical protein EX269_14465 [Acidimicrobiales bacterium]|nr:MAG: hypothetical protein EX269_14465 [Acidimicrobiales bacterium]
MASDVSIDITPRPEGAYRIAVWSVGPGIERKYRRLEALDANVVVTARAADEVRLLRAGKDTHTSMAWVGRRPTRGLGVIGFDPTHVKIDGGRWDQRLEWVMPTLVAGPVTHSLVAVWALHEKAKVQLRTAPPASQPIQMLRTYAKWLNRPTVIAGDFNNNPMLHRNDPNHDMLEFIASLETAGFVSAYHVFTGLEHGDPREPSTRFKPDPIVGVAAMHVDYCFVPDVWLRHLLNVQIGSREEWARSGRVEEHVPVVVDFDADAIQKVNIKARAARPPSSGLMPDATQLGE